MDKNDREDSKAKINLLLAKENFSSPWTLSGSKLFRKPNSPTFIFFS